MTVDDIERLIRRLERSGIDQLEVSDATSSLVLHLAPTLADSPAAGSPPAAEPGVDGVLRARAVGHFRLRHPEAAAGRTDVPRAVRKGDVVAFLEAASCLRPVLADADGTVGSPLQADGCLVGYGTPLFQFLSAGPGIEP